MVSNKYRIFLMTILLVIICYNVSVKCSNEQKQCEPLNLFITCFEETKLDILVKSASSTIITLQGFGRNFTLFLNSLSKSTGRKKGKYDKILQVSNLAVTEIGPDGMQKYTYTASKYYTGHVEGVQSSFVHGSLENDVFSGIIKVENETFYVEETEKYLSLDSGRKPMVMFRSDDIQFWEQQYRYSGKAMNHFENKPADFSVIHKHDITKHKELIPSNNGFNSKHSDVQDVEFSHAYKSIRYCGIKVVVDHTFFENTGRGNRDVTIAEVLFHITEVDSIFQYIDFDRNGRDGDIGLAMSEIVIYSSINSPDYVFSVFEGEVGKELHRFAEYDHSDVCLALLFTHRDYDGPALGMAYLAHPSRYGHPGGLCQPPIMIGGSVSLNSLLVTDLSYGAVIPRKEVTLIVAHEFGHAFGSDHDPQNNPVCSPVGDLNKFLMHPQKVSNMQRKFSSCSIESMALVIAGKGQNCLNPLHAPICGNQIVEYGEECDCGFVEQCEQFDKCCIPASRQDSSAGCEIDSTKGVCSPKASKCCTSDCQVLTVPNNTVLCKEETECTEKSFCDGLSSVCPVPVNVPDDTPCFGGQFLCEYGLCWKSVCSLIKAEVCLCSDNKYEESFCELCCTKNETADDNTESVCVPASSLGLKNENGSVIKLMEGQPCKNYTGFCSKDLICLINTEKSWLYQYWYILVIIILIVIIVGVIFGVYLYKRKKRRIGNM